MLYDRIPDSDIPGADPARVVAQYEPLVEKLANRYTSILDRSGAVDLDDLYQVGRLAVLQAQKQYDPAAGASFLTFIYKPVQWAIMNEVGIDANTGKLPEQLVSLDKPLNDEEELTLKDTIADPAAVPMDEPIIEEETRRETSIQVRAALERMKSDKQRTAVSLVWLDGKTREQAADEMGLKMQSFYSVERYGRGTLYRDYKLRAYAMQMPSFRVGLNRFNQTFTSAVEAEVIWKDEHLPGYNRRETDGRE